MTLTPNFLPVGSIVNPISGDHRFNKPLKEVYCRIVSINETSCEVKQVNDDSDASPWKFHLTNIAGIPLTPEILTDWCNFCVKDMGSSRLFYIGVNPITHDYLFDLTWLDKPELINSPNAPFYRNGAHHIYFLHQLQHLYSALTQTVLPIQIK